MLFELNLVAIWMRMLFNYRGGLQQMQPITTTERRWKRSPICANRDCQTGSVMSLQTPSVAQVPPNDLTSEVRDTTSILEMQDFNSTSASAVQFSMVFRSQQQWPVMSSDCKTVIGK